MAATQLYLIRHGEVEARYQRVFGGRIDMNLSPQGHEQATSLAKYMKRVPLDAIYSSPMKRAQQTLAPLLVAYEMRATTMPDLCEVHFGDWTGLGWQEVHDKFQVSAFQWLEMMERAAVPNGECSQTFRGRIEPCVRQILKSHESGRVAIVCHGGVVRMILSILLDLPLPKLAHFDVEYASVTHLQYSPEKSEIVFMNFTPWRDLP